MTREKQMQDMMTAAFWRDIEEGNQPDNGDAIEIAKTYERAYQHGWQDADQHPNWIPVEDDLPKETGWYLVATPTLNSKIDVAFWKGKWHRLITITHWMSLPQPPRKEE